MHKKTLKGLLPGIAIGAAIVLFLPLTPAGGWIDIVRSALSGGAGANAPAQAAPAAGATAENVPKQATDYPLMLADPDSYIGAKIENLPGKVTGVYPTSGTYSYMCLSSDDWSDGTSFVLNNTKDWGLEEGDYIYVTGTILGASPTGDGTPGAVALPLIDPETVKKADVNPFNLDLGTIEPRQTATQNGVTIELRKIVAAEKDTRIYVKVVNDSSSRIGVSASTTFIQQGKKQLDYIYPAYEDKEALQAYINAGIESEGILTFGKISSLDEPFTINIGIRSDDYKTEFKPFVFGVPEGYGVPETPEFETLAIDKTKRAGGIAVTLEKIEQTEDLTLAYLKVANDSGEKITINDYSSYITQNRTQYDYTYSSRSSAYRDAAIKTEINDGIESEGHLSFERLKNLSDPFTITINIRSADYGKSIPPVIFEIIPPKLTKT